MLIAINKYKPRAIIIVHLYGIIHHKINCIRQLCKDKNIYLIEDASHSLGTLHENQSIFKNSFISCISLYPTKVFGSCENAGIISTTSDDINKKIRILRDHGRDNTRYEHVDVGNNSLISSISATFLSLNLKNLPTLMIKTKSIYKIYKRFLNNLNVFKINNISDDIIPNGYMFTLECKSGYMLKSKIQQLYNEGIVVGNIYPETISNQKGFDPTDIKELNGKSINITKRIINLPIYYDLNSHELTHIINTVTKIDKIDVVIIGYGKMGKKHYNELLENNLFNIIGIIDPYLKNCSNIKIIKNIEEAVQLGAFSVVISTPTNTHYDIIQECLKFDLHILVEKPAFIDYKDYTNIKPEKYNDICVGMIERYNPALEHLKFIDKNLIQTITITRICKYPPNNDTSILLYDIGIHDLDILEHIYGNIKILKIDKKDNIVITILIGKINVIINISYSNTISKREYRVVLTDNTPIYINLDSNIKLLKYQHNDWFKQILGKQSKIALLSDNQSIIKKLNYITYLKI